MIRKALLAIAAAATLAVGSLATAENAEARHRHSGPRIGIYIGHGVGFGHGFGRHQFRRGHCHVIRHRHSGHRHAHRACHRHRGGHF